MSENSNWGYVRESRAMAQKHGSDPDTGITRTGIEDYLKVIFPEISEEEWIFNKQIPNSGCRYQPDYRCEKLKLIIEIDGIIHYKDLNVIKKDRVKDDFYQKLGYKVVRIPYFIQLTNEVVKIMFDRDVDTPLFDSKYASMGVKNSNTPACCCYAGIERMAQEFHKYKQQYEVNIEALKFINDELSTAVSVLEKLYQKYGS